MSVIAHKNYLADKKPFYGHFYPKSITITAVRSVLMPGLVVFNNYVASLTIEDTEDEDDSSEDEDDLDRLKKKANKPEPDEFVPPTKEEFAISVATGFSKSISITTCLRLLEEFAIKYFRAQVVGKLVKDLSKSATRKYMRSQSRFTSAALMVKTGMRANVLSHVSIFLIEEAHQVILILCRRYRSKNGGKNAAAKMQGQLLGSDAEKKKATPTFLQITMKNATRSGLAVVTGGVCAAVGTFVRPGLGTVVGAMVGDTIAYVI